MSPCLSKKHFVGHVQTCPMSKEKGCAQAMAGVSRVKVQQGRHEHKLAVLIYTNTYPAGFDLSDVVNWAVLAKDILIPNRTPPPCKLSTYCLLLILLWIGDV